MTQVFSWNYSNAQITKTEDTGKQESILRNIWSSGAAPALDSLMVFVVDANEDVRQPAVSMLPRPEKLMVFAAWSDSSAVKVNNFITHLAKISGLSAEALLDNQAALENGSGISSFNWNLRKVYVPLENGVLELMNEEVDNTLLPAHGTCADELLQLKDRGLRSIAILPVGKSALSQTTRNRVQLH